MFANKMEKDLSNGNYNDMVNDFKPNCTHTMYVL